MLTPFFCPESTKILQSMRFLSPKVFSAKSIPAVSNSSAAATSSTSMKSTTAAKTFCLCVRKPGLSFGGNRNSNLHGFPVRNSSPNAPAASTLSSAISIRFYADHRYPVKPDPTKSGSGYTGYRNRQDRNDPYNDFVANHMHPDLWWLPILCLGMGGVIIAYFIDWPWFGEVNEALTEWRNRTFGSVPDENSEMKR